ncbi:MAG TPA: hypothetical protein VIU64_06145, partial [Polyangia bacterium]
MRRRPASRLVASIVRATAFATVTAGLVLGAVSARAGGPNGAVKQSALPELAVVTTGAATARSTAPSPSRRLRELDDLRRRDVARDLGARGVAVQWQEHPLAELLDWRD